MKTCFLFPGQGAQYPGMAKDLHDAFDPVKSLFSLASEASGKDLRALLFEGTEEDLKRTDNTQLAVTLADLAAAAALKELGVVADGCAGHSLGEWAALADAGVIGVAEAFALVAERGRCMDRAAKASGDCGMTAVLFLAPEKVEQVIAESALPGLYVANYNSPVQTVISGLASSLAKAEELLAAAGAKKVVRLKVSGAFHSPHMEAARAEFAVAVGKAAFKAPTKELYSNVTGARVDDPARIKELALMQIVSPVRWTAEEEAIKAAGYGRCLEAGPGNVLSGLWKAASKEIPCAQAGNLEQAKAAAAG